MEICYCCLANSGEKPIFPGGAIANGKYWILEHAFPTSLLGWSVVRLKRHCERLHELAKDEFDELNEIQYKAIQALEKLLKTKKEYISCFSEKEGFKHIHFHIVPITENMGAEEIGLDSFKHLKPKENEALSEQTILEFCRTMRLEIDPFGSS